MGTVEPRDWSWITRPHAPGEPARHVAELSEAAGMEALRANVWRYEPGAAGITPPKEERSELLDSAL